MSWRVMLVAIVVMGAIGCAKNEPVPLITAERLGEPFDGSALDELPMADTSVWVHLTPAERQALADQGYEIHVDEDERLEALELQRQRQLEGEEDDSLETTLDHAGRASISIAAVAMAVGMMVAPFFMF